MARCTLKSLTVSLDFMSISVMNMSLLCNVSSSLSVELSEDNIWNDDENEDVDEEFENMNEEDEAFKMNLKSLQLAKRGGKLVEGQLWKTPTMPKARRHSVILSHDNDASSTDESPALFGSILRRWKTAANTDVDTVLSADPNPSTALSRSATDYPGSPNSSLRPSLKTAASKIKVARLTTGSSKPDKVGWLSQQRIGRDNKFPPIPLPEQNVKAKKSKKSKPIQGKSYVYHTLIDQFIPLTFLAFA